MKIAILVSLFPPKWLAGTEIATYNTAKHLAKRGHEVHVITSLDEGLPKESMEEGFHVHRIRRRKVRYLGVISFWLKTPLVLRTIEPDIVHSQDIIMGMPGLVAKTFFSKKFVVCGRGTDVNNPGLFMKPLSRLVLGNADAVIALTEDMRKKMQRNCNRDISVIPNGLNLEKFENLSRDETQSKNEKLIIFVGRFRPEKGVKYLIEAMNIIIQHVQPVKLILVGEGPEEEKLKQLVGQFNLGRFINFVGQIPNEKVPQYMVTAYVFVLPSLCEGFPNVLLEAMGSGLPIVATNVCGLPEIIRDGENGFLVEPKNPGQIAENVSLLLEDDELREKISKNNKEKARKYSWDSVVDRLEEVYLRHL